MLLLAHALLYFALLMLITAIMWQSKVHSQLEAEESHFKMDELWMNMVRFGRGELCVRTMPQKSANFLNI